MARTGNACAILLLCGVPGGLTACSNADTIPPEVLEEARSASDALAGDLMGRLFEGLDVGGPVHAVEICSGIALAKAAEYSTPNLHIRRVSLRARNPASEPDLFERDQLRRLEVLHGEGRVPDEVAEVSIVGGQRYLRYLKPIVLREQCLVCHGDLAEVDPDVASVLAERYPGDRATGYRAGDLRGAVSVMVRMD